MMMTSDYDWTPPLQTKWVLSCDIVFGYGAWNAFTPTGGGLVGCKQPYPEHTYEWSNWTSADGRSCGGEEKVRREEESCLNQDPTCPCKNRRDPATLKEESRDRAPCKTTTSTTSTTTTTTTTSAAQTKTTSSTSTISTTSTTATETTITTRITTTPPTNTKPSTTTTASSTFVPLRSEPPRNTTRSTTAVHPDTPGSTVGNSTAGGTSSTRRTAVAVAIISILAVVALIVTTMLLRNGKRSDAGIHEAAAAAAAAAANDAAAVGRQNVRDDRHLIVNQVYGGMHTNERPTAAQLPPAPTTIYSSGTPSSSAATNDSPSSSLYEIVYVFNGNNEYDQWGVGPTPVYSYSNKNNRGRPPSDYYSFADGDGVDNVGSSGDGGGVNRSGRVPPPSHDVSAPEVPTVYAIPMEDNNVVYAIPLEGMDTAGGGGGGSSGAPPSHTGNGDAGRLFDRNTTAFVQPQGTRQRKRKGDGNTSNTGAAAAEAGAQEYDLAAGGNSTNHYDMQAPRVRARPAAALSAAAAPSSSAGPINLVDGHNHYDMQAPRVRRAPTARQQQRPLVPASGIQSSGGADGNATSSEVCRQ